MCTQNLDAFALVLCTNFLLSPGDKPAFHGRYSQNSVAVYKNSVGNYIISDGDFTIADAVLRIGWEQL